MLCYFDVLCAAAFTVDTPNAMDNKELSGERLPCVLYDLLFVEFWVLTR